MKRTVFNNVAFGLRLRKDLVRLEQRVQEALSWVGLNERVFGSRPWYALSGGEAQRVALAARLILKPDVLLLDEPTANVDALSAQLIQEAALKARRDWGTTLIMASHDRQWLHEVADSILHLFKGRMAGNGRENILFGPWEPMGDQRWCKQLPDGQRLQVPPPPGDASAVLISKTVLLTPAEATPAAGRVVVSGMVTRLTLESASGDLLVSVLAGGLPLTVVMHPEQASRSRIYPGRAVAVGYHLADVVWLKA